MVPPGVPRSLFPYVGGGEQGNGCSPGSRGTLGEHLGNRGTPDSFHDHLPSLARYGLTDSYGLVGVT